MGRARVPGHERVRQDGGAAAVEFALVLPLLLLLLFGTFEVGWTLWEHQSGQTAAREGARLAAIGLDDTSRQRFPADVACLARRNGISGNRLISLDVTYSADAAGTRPLDTANPVGWVHVQLTFRSAVTGLPAFVAPSGEFTTTAMARLQPVAPGDDVTDFTAEAPSGDPCAG